MVLLSAVWGRFGRSARDQKRLAIPQLIFVAAFYFSGPPTRDLSFSLKHHESQMETTIKKYKDPQGRTIEVISGIGGDAFFSMHHGYRIKSSFLPLRDTFKAAQDDLDAYAAKKRSIEV